MSYSTLNKCFAFVWLFVIGSNTAQNYSDSAPYQAAFILAGTFYFVFVFGRELRHLLYFKEYLLGLFLLLLPILLMLVSERSFDRNVYIFKISVALVFVVSSLLAVRPDLDKPRASAAFLIVGLGVALNLYELLIQNNVWSIAPGRSAGFYVNPNISGEALLGYGLVFLTSRVMKVSALDLILTALVIIGVFATFSRAGIMASVLLLTAAFLLRIRREHVMRTVIAVVSVSVVLLVFASYIVSSLDLSIDAATRISSLLGGDLVADYDTDRGAAATKTLDRLVEHPVLGLGVQSVAEMNEGPHNMFLWMWAEYGIFGPFLYLVFITSLILISRRASWRLGGPILLYVGWLVIFSFASHNLLEETVTLPLMAFTLVRACHVKSTLGIENRVRSSWVPRNKFKLRRAPVIE